MNAKTLHPFKIVITNRIIKFIILLSFIPMVGFAQPFTVNGYQQATGLSSVTSCGSNYTFSFTQTAYNQSVITVYDNGVGITNSWGTFTGCYYTGWGAGIIKSTLGSYSIDTTIYATITTSPSKTLTFSTTPPTCSVPSISVSASSLTGFTYCAGSGPSASQNFTISGSNLTGSGNITVTAPTNYQVSTDNINFFTSRNYAYASGVITSQPRTVYVRLNTGLAAGNYNSGNITFSGGGVSSPPSVSVSGTVNPATPSTPGTITGTTTQCPSSTGQTYSISAVTNATTYTWAVPTGWSITSGAGSTSITVNSGTAGQNGNITVTAGNGCGTSSARTLAVTVAAIPTITGTTPASRCGTGTVTLAATASSGTINWYANSTGGSPLGTGTSFTTPSISSTTTYWVDAKNGSCTSAIRTAVIATVNTIPSAPTVGSTTQPNCSVATGSVILNNLPTGTWTLTRNDGVKTTGTGTSKTITGLNPGTYTYTVTGEDTSTSCPGSGTGLSAEYFNNRTLTAPTALTRTDATVNFDWASGNPGSPLNNDNFSARWTGKVQPCYTENYTFSTNSDDGIRLWINGVQIINNWTDHAATINNSTPVSLVAGTKYDIVLEYYENSGSAVAQLYWSSASQSYQIIPQSQLYSVATGCTSTNSVNIVINTQPATPTITGTTPASRCGTGTLTLAATASAGTVNWYANSTGGASLATGTSFTTPSISSTTTYWVNATNGSCTTATRTAVTATINTIPTITGTTPASRCGTGTVTLAATASAGTINWYANSTGGSPLGTGTSFTTPSISSTTTYWVDATNGSCTTATRIAVIATVSKNYWTGDVDSNWNNPANWCAGVPINGIEASLNILIPSGLTNYPVISNGATSGYVKTMVIENNATITVLDNSLRITENLKLNGKIDLEGESQLLQDLGSTLDVTSSGTLEIDQQGTQDYFTYNYWSSPVGVINTSSNNNSYTVPDVLRDGSVPASPVTINFLTSGYNGNPGTPGVTPISIADYWIWKYSNRLSNTYSQWQHVRSTGTLLAGEGFTMKGVANTGGSISLQQNYVFYGKPNNGNIILPVSAGNDYLVGNPYPSALDADEFIMDNISVGSGGRAATDVINGTLYFWDHFASSTHTLKTYEGGYATYNLMGGIVAVSTDTRINATGAIGSKLPLQYIPVSQGFFVVADAGGDVMFKNSQRIFRTEASGSSLFFKPNNSKSKNAESKNTDDDLRQKFKLMFDSPIGYHRQLLAGIDDKATNGFDRGYDAPLIEDNKEDMFWVIDNSQYIIQGVDNFSNEQKLPLGVKTNKAGLSKITMDTLVNITDDLNIYLNDKELGIHHNLKESNYEVYLTPGEYPNRFEITFSNNVQTRSLGTDNVENENIQVYFSNEKESIIIHNPILKQLKSVEILNLLGQSIYKFSENTSKNYLEYKTKHISTGAYLIKIQTEEGYFSKKILIQ